MEISVRRRMFNICERLYYFCRWKYERTSDLIDLLVNIIDEHDDELTKFLKRCQDSNLDPRQNNLFCERNEWPSLDARTKADESPEILNTMTEFEQDVPIILKYESIF